jgi:hypothetical protein
MCTVWFRATKLQILREWSLEFIDNTLFQNITTPLEKILQLRHFISLVIDFYDDTFHI